MNFSTLLSFVFCLIVGMLIPAFSHAQLNDIGIEAIIDPVGDQCGGKTTGEVVLKNFGINPITSAQIEYESDGNLIAIYYWFGDLEAGQSELIVFPRFNVSTGTHTFKATTKLPNGLADSDNTNDSKESTFEALNNQGIALPFFEGFEGDFPPANWDIGNADNATSWDSANVGIGGNRSAFMDNYNYDAIGQYDEISTPGISFKKFDKVGLSFYMSYAKFAANSGFSDTLEVLVSGDCGKNFVSVWKKYGDDLATTVATTSAFVPEFAWQWRKEWVDLSDYTDSTYMVIKFRNISNYENNIYIDNININEIFALDIEENLGLENIQLYPNPASDQVNLSFVAQKAGVWNLELMDIAGKSIWNKEIQAITGENKMFIDVAGFPRGMYMVKFANEDASKVEKLILD